MRDWAEAAENPRLIVIDVFNKVKPKHKGAASNYDADYRALGPLKELADVYGIAILVLHHTRKLPAHDPFHTVSGSTGFTGAADTVLILARKGGQVTLAVPGVQLDK
jgi:AAA domain